MGIDVSLRPAVAKALMAAGLMLPRTGRILVTIADKDKSDAVGWLKMLGGLDYECMQHTARQR